MSRIILLHHVAIMGGGTNSLIDIAKMLKDEHEVIVCVPGGNSNLTAILTHEGLLCHEMETQIPSLNVYSGSPAYASRYFLSRLFRFVHGKDVAAELMSLAPDTIVYNTSVTSPIARWIPAEIRNIGFVRETFSKRWATHLFRNVYESCFSGVAFIADHERKVLGLSRPVQAIIPDCLDPMSIKPMSKVTAREFEGIPQDAFVALFMGGDAPIKGLDVFLDACRQIDGDCLAVVAGSYHKETHASSYIARHAYNIPYARQLIRINNGMRALESERRVLLAGYRQDISALMSACDVVVFPSTKAHQPRPCIEAGEYRKPVILSDFEATAEYFSNGKNALTFIPNNSSDLAEKLRYARSHPLEMERMGLSNYQASRSLHDYTATQDKLRAFLGASLGR